MKNREVCNQRTAAIRLRYIKERRCTSCSAILEKCEIRTCVNCGHTVKGEMKYAKDSKRLAQKP
jgi:rRNA maturation endonuclease Nob1